MNNLTITLYGKNTADGPLMTGDFPDVESLRKHAVKAQQMGVYFRMSFEATVALIQDGAYGVDWETLREIAVAEEIERRHDSGDYDSGLGSSDCNHLTVGYVYGFTILAKDEQPDPQFLARIEADRAMYRMAA